MSGDCPNNSNVEIGQNTVKSPGDLRRLVVVQTPEENHQLTLMWKTVDEKNNKFDYTNKWYLHNLESAVDNVTHQLLLDLEIETDKLTSARRPDLMIINKK